MVVQAPKSAVTLKIFIGIAITSELKMHLNHSIGWKHARMITEVISNELEAVHFHQKDFIGCYIQSKSLTLEELRTKASTLKQKLAEYCPSVDIHKTPICIFPQLFVA